MRKSLLAVLLATIGLPQAGACGLHGTIDNPFTAGYPGSILVSLRTQQAVVNGQLSALPEIDNAAAQNRLDARLAQLRTRLEKAQLQAGFALLVVEASHWSRFAANGRDVQIASHTAPAADEPVLLTSEAALAALLEGRIAAADAMRAGLVRWSGNAPPTLAQALQLALADGA